MSGLVVVMTMALSGVACTQEAAVETPADSDAGASDASDAFRFTLPDACPSPEPSFATDVAPIIDARCNACHGEGGVEQPVFDYTTYQGVFMNRTEMIVQVTGGLMPPADAAALTPAEGETLLGWIVCGAPND